MVKIVILSGIEKGTYLIV